MIIMQHNDAERVSRITTIRREVGQRVRLAVTDPRGWVAWRLHGAGNALLGLASRILPGEAGATYADGWRDGAEWEHKHPRRATRQEIADALERLGFTASDDNMAKFGFGPLAVAS